MICWDLLHLSAQKEEESMRETRHSDTEWVGGLRLRANQWELEGKYGNIVAK